MPSRHEAAGAPKRSALVQQVIEVLRGNITSGRWPVGSRLPFESELLEQLEVSRVTLRQAVQALVHVGVLETIQGSGTFVRASNELDAVLSRFLAGEELRFLLEARLAIEGQAAQLAAARATPHDLAVLRAILDDSDAAAERRDLDALAPLSAQFHQSVVIAAHNPVLTHLHRALDAGTERTVREGSSHQPLSDFVAEHRSILHAVERRDEATAFTGARAHLLDVLRHHPSPETAALDDLTASSG